MECVLLPVPVPGPIEFGLVGAAAPLALLAGCVPGWLALRQVLRRRSAERARPPLRALQGGDLRRWAA
jgi:hypothetical protein